jgi:hypothetical protein
MDSSSRHGGEKEHEAHPQHPPFIVSATRTVTDERGHTTGVTVSDVADARSGRFLAEVRSSADEGGARAARRAARNRVGQSRLLTPKLQH